jgi:Predicted Co/Zn/Cd cation transporters
VPVARNNESVRERIMVIARNSGLAVHHVTVHDLGGKLTVSIDLEVDGDMPLTAAHAIAHELERNIREEFGEDVEVDTHIEPLEPELPVVSMPRRSASKPSRPRCRASPPMARSMTSIACGCAIPTPAKSSTSTAAPRHR